MEQWSIVGLTCLSSWASVPLIDWVDSLYMLHKALSVPPIDEKVVFYKGPDPLSCGGFSPISQHSSSAEWTLWLTWPICLCVDCGGKLQEKKAPH